VGLSLVGHVGADAARRLLGRRSLAARDRRRAQGRRLDYATWNEGLAAAAARALAAASDKLAADFGSWKTPWGDINRFQRLTGDIVQPFTMRAEHPGRLHLRAWGSLASFGAQSYKDTKKMYGTSGNSFVAVVEFGGSGAGQGGHGGGESGDPKSPHFNDQAAALQHRRSEEVYFYRPQLEGHTKRQYHPSE
jgi:acyl-homoserine-lactone acylase